MKPKPVVFIVYVGREKIKVIGNIDARRSRPARGGEREAMESSFHLLLLVEVERSERTSASVEKISSLDPFQEGEIKKHQFSLSSSPARSSATPAQHLSAYLSES